MARSTFERGGTSGSVCGPEDESNAESSHARRHSNFINQDPRDPSKRPMITLDAKGFADMKICESSDDSSLHLKGLVQGPLRHAWSHIGYFINGFKFHMEKYGEGQVTHNSGVCVKGACYNETDCDFYGLLEEVIEVAYYGVGHCVMILFKYGDDNGDGEESFQESETLIPTTSRSSSEIEEPVCLVIQGELEIVNNNGDETQTELSDEAEQSDEAEFLDNSDESDDDSDDIFNESSDNE
ncbi:hypothetical protein Tco_1441889 [Tanacetum coccineum]